MTFISVTVSGSSAGVCVETEDATTVQLILVDATDQRHVRDSEKLFPPPLLTVLVDIFFAHHNTRTGTVNVYQFY